MLPKKLKHMTVVIEELKAENAALKKENAELTKEVQELSMGSLQDLGR